jgi:hypothetical protein
MRFLHHVSPVAKLRRQERMDDREHENERGDEIERLHHGARL